MFTHLYKIWKPGALGQWIVAFVGCWCSFTSGQAFSWPGPALPKLRSGSAGFSVNMDEESWMVTVTFLGNILSPVPAGYIMDKIGRKNTLHVSILLAIASWIIIYFFHSAIALYVARALIGTWAGFVYTVVPVLVGEVVSPEIRGSMGSMFGVMLYLGALYESLVGMFFSYDILSLASMVPPIVLFLILFLLPESPYYHLMKGDKKEAKAGIEWLRGECDADDLDEIEESVNEQLANRGQFIDILQVRPYRRAFIVVEALGAIQRMAGLTLLLSYASVTIPDSFVTGEQSIIVLDVVWILGSFVTLFVMDKYGRRTLFFVSSLGSSLTMLAVTIWYFLSDLSTIDTTTTEWFPLIGLIGNAMFYAIGLVSIPTLIQGELFPVNIKGKASALACITMAVTSAISVKLYQPFTEYVGVYMNFLVCGVFCALGTLFSITYMVETRGKSLEEIQDILSEKKRKRKRKNVSA